ncbi:MAG: glycosyltransferase family 2 protein [Saprospiraceae bacterium]|nr:glycosyltransferase family 2 protein [Saprospiraceae bacterium]
MMKDTFKLSILICTYNRCDILAECLESLTKQTALSDDFEVIVVNNNSFDQTQEIAENFIGKVPNLRVVIEIQQGLSYARNRAYEEAKADWVLYLDDDALASENLVERALWTIEHHDFKMFGGVALPWYKYPKPHWYKDKYVATNQLPYKSVSKIHGNQFAIGCIMVIHKATLAQYRGFDVRLGMIGNKIAYNEEVELQKRLRADGIPIAHDPELFIQHLVAPYKLDVDWFFKSAFALGRDNVDSKNVNKNPFNLLLISLIAFGMMLVHLVIYTPRLLQKNYYIENWLIDVFKKVAKRVGTVYTALLKK